MSESRPAQPKVIVLILCYNAARWIEACLQTVLAVTYPQLEIVVLDNCSTDQTAALLQPYLAQLTFMQNTTNAGFAAGNNVGIEYALQQGADYVVLLNPDTRLHPDCLAQLIEAAERNPALGIVGALQLEYDSHLPNRWTREMLRLERTDEAALAQLPAQISLEWVEASCMAIKRAVLKQIGLLDPIFFSFYEEIDLCRRARAVGWQVALLSEARFHHQRGGSWQSDAQRQRARDYQCDKSQYIYMLTAPKGNAFANLGATLRTFAVKLKTALQGGDGRAVLNQLRLPFALLPISAALWRKWRRDGRMVQTAQ